MSFALILPMVMVMREMSCLPARCNGSSATGSCSPPSPMVLPDENTAQIEVWGMRPDAEGFAAGESGDTQGIAQAEPLPHQSIHVEFRPVPQAHAGHDVERDSFLRLTGAVQAVGSRILRGKPRVALDDVGVLNVQVSSVAPAVPQARPWRVGADWQPCPTDPRIERTRAMRRWRSPQKPPRPSIRSVCAS